MHFLGEKRTKLYRRYYLGVSQLKNGLGAKNDLQGRTCLAWKGVVRRFDMKYWINTIAKDHVMRGVAGGFTQANHGKNTILKRLKADDWIVFYSPKTAYQNGEPLQTFTAIGQVKGDDLYQVEKAPDFVPWRRNVTFYDCSETSIKPLIEGLSFIQDKTHWGYKFRFGLFGIPKIDFDLIHQAMETTGQKIAFYSKAVHSMVE